MMFTTYILEKKYRACFQYYEIKTWMYETEMPKFQQIYKRIAVYFYRNEPIKKKKRKLGGNSDYSDIKN